MASENEDSDHKETRSKTRKSKFSLQTVKKLKSLPEVDVFSYIDDLHEAYKKHEKKIKKYKEKIKHLTKKLAKLQTKSKSQKADSAEQVAIGNQSELPTANSDITPEEKKPLSFLDEIREAAENAQNDNGFIYEPTSGLYYDQNTGYYYNAEYGLYYDGSSGCYYSFDQEANKFTFHSKVVAEPDETDQIQDSQNALARRGGGKSKRAKKRKKRKTRSSSDDEDREDGELESATSESDDCVEVINLDDNPSTFEDVAKKYPPSLRIVVQDTNLEKLKIGTLYMVTFKGGSLGREGNHEVIIPDLNVSKFHLKFTYNEDKSIYQCVDLGSRNGTILNGKRMSTGKQESEEFDLVHGSVIQVGQTKLLCHIHSGNSTCGLCEPGLLMDTRDAPKSVALSHKEGLKKLQRKYGLENEKYIENKSDPNYKDRAATRREKVGSSTDAEKTQAASVHTEIPSQNKGFKMLSKLGWNKGESLGKANNGLLEPIPTVGNEGKKGLGSKQIGPSVPLSKVDMRKMDTWRKAQERYSKLPKADIFCDSGSD